MTFEEIKQRIAMLKGNCDQTAGQHNMMMGRLQEAQEALAFMEKQAADALEAAKKAIEGEVAPPPESSAPTV